MSKPSRVSSTLTGGRKDTIRPLPGVFALVRIGRWGGYSEVGVFTFSLRKGREYTKKSYRKVPRDVKETNKQEGVADWRVSGRAGKWE